jgi:hypothetical protein
MNACILSSLILLIIVLSEASENWGKLVPGGCKTEDKVIYSCRNTGGTEKKTCSFKKTSGITYSHSEEHGITMEKSMEESKLQGNEYGLNLNVMGQLFGGGFDTKFREEVTKVSGEKEGWAESNTVENSFTTGTEVSEEVTTPPGAISHITSKVIVCGPFTINIGTSDVKDVFVSSEGGITPTSETSRNGVDVHECNETCLRKLIEQDGCCKSQGKSGRIGCFNGVMRCAS